jgi:phosphonate transport system permease protein
VLLAAGAWSFIDLGLRLDDLWPSAGGLELAGRFFGRALSPALTSEARFVSANASPLLETALRAAGATLLYAAAALGLALVGGLLLGFLASSAWWAADPGGGDARWLRAARSGAARTLQIAVRTLIAVLRSVHEIIWAVLFLAAVGLSEVGALLAIAIPYAGVLAKVFSEMIDEAPRGAADALRACGASGAQTFCVALIPAAFPDVLAYTFYRMECAIRSATILGFFGFPTLGLYIRQSFASTSYGEVWTYLYVLIALVLAFDVWSGAIRSRLAA